MSDDIISHHFVEQGRPHLTGQPGQDQFQMNVIRRQMRLAGWRDLRAQMVLRRRLAAFYKRFGDDVRSRSLREARAHYARAMALWPVDHVVCARVALWTRRAPFDRCVLGFPGLASATRTEAAVTGAGRPGGARQSGMPVPGIRCLIPATGMFPRRVRRRFRQRPTGVEVGAAAADSRCVVVCRS
jgi:hypothetical protein